MSPRFFSKRKIVCFLKAYDCFFNVIFPISYEKKSNIKNWQTQEWLFELTSFWIMTLRKISIGNCKYRNIFLTKNSRNGIVIWNIFLQSWKYSGASFKRTSFLYERRLFVVPQNCNLTHQLKKEVIFFQKFHL